MGDSKTGDDEMTTDSKLEPPRENTPSSIESDGEQEDAGAEPSLEQAQPQKRKGGRKPIYATSEERKQRNRQAQAAFRERRTEYIKQLEATIKQNEDTLNSLQQSHRSAADECLMLRYKNSLLERILLEKGIDVQAELQMKTGSPTLNFPHHGANVPNIPAPLPPLQRTAIQRHQARRSGQNFLPRLAPGRSSQDMTNQSSPKGHPTPSSHASSPTNISRSPMIMQQGGSTPPTSAGVAQPQTQHYHTFSRISQPPLNQNRHAQQPFPPNIQRSGHHPAPPSHHRNSASIVSSPSTGSRHSHTQSMSAGAGSSGDGSQPQYYTSPFQKHIDRLEQEYDSHDTRAMLDANDTDIGDADLPPDSMHGNYHIDAHHSQRVPAASDYYQPPSSTGMGHSHHIQMQATSLPPGNDGHFPASVDMIDPNDPMLDADPFGLSASMHYSTSYSFEQPTQR